MSGDDWGENNALSTAIVEQVNQHWDRSKRAVLLSALGLILRQQGKWDGRAAPYTLRSYVNAFMGDKLRIETRPGVESVIGLFPIDAELNGDLAAYFTPAPTVKVGPPAFRAFVWQAFQTDMPPGKCRIIDLRRGLTQERNSPVTQLSADEYLLEAVDQPLPAFRRDAKATRAAIDAWAGKYMIDRRRLSISTDEAEATIHEGPVAPRRSLLEMVLNTLNTKDQERISVPLDIVDKLRRQLL